MRIEVVRPSAKIESRKPSEGRDQGGGFGALLDASQAEEASRPDDMVLLAELSGAAVVLSGVAPPPQEPAVGLGLTLRGQSGLSLELPTPEAGPAIDTLEFAPLQAPASGADTHGGDGQELAPADPSGVVEAAGPPLDEAGSEVGYKALQRRPAEAPAELPEVSDADADVATLEPVEAAEPLDAAWDASLDAGVELSHAATTVQTTSTAESEAMFADGGEAGAVEPTAAAPDSGSSGDAPSDSRREAAWETAIRESDARVRVQDRSVRVQVDDGLALEVALRDGEMDVAVEGSDDTLDDMGGLEQDLRDELGDSEMPMRTYEERAQRGDEQVVRKESSVEVARVRRGSVVDRTA